MLVDADLPDFVMTVVVTVEVISGFFVIPQSLCRRSPFSSTSLVLAGASAKVTNVDLIGEIISSTRS